MNHIIDTAPSNANNLAERLRRRLETERREIEELTASELEQLGTNSRRVASNALRTIGRYTEAATGRIRALLLKACISRRPARPWRGSR